jgi:hypothetical protein
MFAALTTLVLRAVLALQLLLTPQGAIPTPAPRNLTVVTVGVSQYQNPKANVPGPDHGAYWVAEVFRRQQGPLYDRVEVLTLVNEQATHANVEAALALVRERLARGETVVVYLCGHGGIKQGQWHFFLHDATFGDTNGALSGQALKARLAGLPGQAILIVDSCHSGGLLDCGGPETIGSDNLVVFASCRANEVSRVRGLAIQISWIEAQIGVGAYTSFVVEALLGEADADGDGTVTLAEVDVYVAARTSDWIKRHPMAEGQQKELAEKGITETQTPRTSRPGSVSGNRGLIQLPGRLPSVIVSK